MAITATFKADFESFYSAVSKANVSLKTFEQGAEGVERKLTTMGNSFSGVKIIQDAHLMTRAMLDAGGMASLTDKELRRLGDTVNEASEKMRKMGMEVPPGFQRISDATKAIGTESTATSRLAGELSTRLAGMFTVGAVIGFGKAVISAGDAIQKMADQTGLSIAEVQKLQYIAGQSGTSVDSLVGAVQNLQQRLGDDNSGAAAAMKKLGINADAFNKLSTYEQMTSLAEAVRGIQNPTEQASTAAALFGKTWKEILPAIKSGMVEVGNQAPKMADETVKSLARMDEALKRAQQQALVWGGTLVTAIEGAGFALGDFLSIYNPEHFGVSTSQILKMQGAFNDPGGLKNAIASIPPHATNMMGALAKVGMSSTDTAVAIAKLTTQTRTLSTTETDAQKWSKTWTLALADVRENSRALGRDIDIALIKIDNFSDGMAASAPTIGLLTGLHSYAQGLQSIGDAASGARLDVQQFTKSGLDKLSSALGNVEGVLGGIQSTWAQMAVVGARAIQTISQKLAEGDWVGAIVAASAAVGQFISKLFGKSEETSKVSPLRDEFFKIQGGLETLNPKVLALTGNLKAVENIFAAKTVEQYNKALKELSDILANLPSPEITGTVHWNVDDLPDAPDYSGFTGDQVDGAFTGGMVGPLGIQHFGKGGRVLPWRARGTDTVPAMLTPGEMVLNRNQQAAVSALMQGGGSGSTEIHIHTDLNGREIAHEVTRIQNSDYQNRRKVRAG